MEYRSKKKVRRFRLKISYRDTTMPRGVVTAKLHAYGLSDDACNMVIGYL